MTTTATHNEHDTTTERVLFVAFELSEKTWKLGFTMGPAQKPRERAVAARNQGRLLQEITQAKRRFGLPESAPVVSCYEAGAYSTPNLPLIPRESCHLFHTKVATDSTRKLPPIPREAWH